MPPILQFDEYHQGIYLMQLKPLLLTSVKNGGLHKYYGQARESYNEDDNYVQDTSDNQVSETVRDSKVEEANTESQNIEVKLDRKTSLTENREVKVSSSVKVESFLIDD